MAGGVADRKQDWAMQLFGRLERLVAPRIPVEGVVSVLAQVGARLEEEPVGVFRRAVTLKMRRARLVIRISGRPGSLDFLHQRFGESLRSWKWLGEIRCT